MPVLNLLFRKGCFNDTRNTMHVDEYVVRYTCPQGTVWRSSNTTFQTNGTYNEGTNLLIGLINWIIDKKYFTCMV